MKFLTQLKIPGTRSFRLSSSKLFDYGGNSQNNDKETQDIFEAPPDWKFVQADQSGAEALIVAYLAKAGRYRELFTEGLKPHIYVALHLFIDKFRGAYPHSRYWLQRPKVLMGLEEWAQLSKVIKSSKFEYDIGKRTGHAKNYRMGPYTFQEQTLKESEGSLVLTYEEARSYLKTYEELFPEIIELQHIIEDKVRRERVLFNLFGYPRRFERIFTDGYIREAISWIPQSTVAVITHKAFTSTSNRIQREGLHWRPCSNKHDSYTLLVPDGEIDIATHELRTQLAQTLHGWDGTEFTMRSEVQVGQNLKKWSEDNPQGMKEYL